MKIVIAPDSFKESLTAHQVAEYIKEGFQEIYPYATYYTLPIGDGGEGTMSILSEAFSATKMKINVSGPFGDEVPAEIAFTKGNQKALIEMAEACGLHLVPLSQRNPLLVSTKGVGELILYAIQKGAREIIVGIGGSASNDGGIGMASALGYEFLDNTGQTLEAIGVNLAKIATINAKNVPAELKNVTINVVTDVENPLCGEKGATFVFGPQKGLLKTDLLKADEAMQHFYQLANSAMLTMPRAGAGGGIGAGLATFLEANLLSGIDFVLEALQMQAICKDADLVIVGEGKMDGQTAEGKAPVGVAKQVPHGIPVIAICGSVGDGLDAVYEAGITAVFASIAQPATLEQILKETPNNLRRTARNVAAVWKGRV
ncbi:glycerate kinase [Listeria ivanovii]|uniref:Glycerate kinase n=1 Tax=Listeria ivanovii (strain ATCC BAA-678 / PAM 55) TaxID=881621 RepID=G2Z9X0_LISIP|nr:glycerate kinase [Listeria ivanovii]AHI54608.1 glycerate kinase [Listeria ivanovii WSLC3009]AIS64082.1 glycerate kinase [Listeria ivanovii subsp. ivanovii]MBC1759646.1 glycerate kinase [Listeria ivanovii]MBK3914780.1 glycerate kinase [Listeria ivanovii subsp. ivanovii]MBK3922060.1 glycerate kinase [Listeria ivanovii subsp. ivanovii]